MPNQNFPALRRVFGLRETVTITVGTVIGVGLFTVGASVVGTLGAAVLLATLVAAAISIYPALLYAEMGAALPLSGGTYQYAKYGLGRPFGMLAGWNFIISMISVASGEALAFSFYVRTLFEAFGVAIPVSDTAIACAAVLLFLLLGIFGVEMTGRMQNAFLFFFWGVAVVWVFAMIPHLQFGNFSSLLPLTPTNFFRGIAMIWWCFAGFETCCSMGEEIRHPQVNLPRALFLAPFIVFAVNGLCQWVLVCIVPPEGLAAVAAASAPYAEAMKTAGAVGFPLILLCLGIAVGGDFSTLNASVAAPARYLVAMSRDGVLPRFFSYVHPRFRTPVVAFAVPGLITCALVLTDSVAFIATLSLFATLFYYIIGMSAACGLRCRHPELRRPYRVKGIRVGAPVSILIYLLLMTQLDRDAVLLGVAWCTLGLVLYTVSVLASRRKNPAPARRPVTLAEFQKRIWPPPPSAEGKRRMDREYRIWKAVVFSACGAVILLNALSFFL